MKIVCLGDSLTSCPGVEKSVRWITLLERETKHHWVCEGVPGDTVAGMTARLQSILLQKPDAVFLLGGVNDILISGNSNSAKVGMMSLIHQCVAAGVKPVVGIPYEVIQIPPELEIICDWQNAKCELSSYVLWLRTLKNVFHLRSVDFAEAFAATERTKVLQPDGMHPSEAGCRLMANAIIENGFFA